MRVIIVRAVVHIPRPADKAGIVSYLTLAPHEDLPSSRRNPVARLVGMHFGMCISFLSIFRV